MTGASRSKKTPRKPSVVWTYPSRPATSAGLRTTHRDFLRRLLGDMGLPKGSHAFWPLNRYPYGEEESEATVDARLFLSGVDALGPDSVILMCGEVPPELGLADLRPLLPCIVTGGVSSSPPTSTRRSANGNATRSSSRS
ncbi:MAG: hypothetical protein V8Q84_00215 [Bilophila sp.]